MIKLHEWVIYLGEGEDAWRTLDTIEVQALQKDLILAVEILQKLNSTHIVH
jgi:hypothetical protein